MLESIRSHLAAGRCSQAMDVVYDAFDDLMLKGRLDEASEKIREICAAVDMPLCILLGVLTISLPWRNQLGAVRVDAAARARAVAMASGGEAKANAALRGLE